MESLPPHELKMQKLHFGAQKHLRATRHLHHRAYSTAQQSRLEFVSSEPANSEQL